MAKFEGPFLRTPYNYDRDVVSNETGLKCADVSLAVQSARDECDINTIVNRFGLTGKLPDDVRAPQSGDFTGVSSYQEALNILREAQASFMEMPANVRSRFENDPGQFVAFCDDPANLPEMDRLGLVKKPLPVPAPLRVEVVVPPVTP
ncbi:MAG: internal scaffolding protein [Microvirus sp.]|nr:MAG: internal scaffolding protein [Microvirus sp.]